MKATRAIPTLYRGITMRSTLEADWAQNLDALGMEWAYEPEAFQIGDTQYRPDFYLPGQDVWLEVKGPHDQRLGKTRDLYDAIQDYRGDDWWNVPLVIIGRAPTHGCLTWHSVTGDEYIVIGHCDIDYDTGSPGCDRSYFGDLYGDWTCRYCRCRNKHHRPAHATGELPFDRAPRIAA